MRAEPGTTLVVTFLTFSAEKLYGGKWPIVDRKGEDENQKVAPKLVARRPFLHEVLAILYKLETINSFTL